MVLLPPLLPSSSSPEKKEEEASMADSSSRGPASFTTQTNALLRKNLTFQKRNCKSNAMLLTFPIFLCLLILSLQILIKNTLRNVKEPSCGCACVIKNADGKCAKTECGVQYSNMIEMPLCAIPSPPRWPPLLDLPRPLFRAVKTGILPFTDLPDESCRKTSSCPLTVLLTGGNQSFGESLGEKLFNSGLADLNSSDVLDTLANFYLGSDINAGLTNLLEPAFISSSPIYDIQPQCPPNSTSFVTIQIASSPILQEIRCLRSLHLWRKSSSVINDEIFKGYQDGNSEGKINEIVTAYDFLNSDENNFNVSIWYNSSRRNDIQDGVTMLRAPRLVNAVSNAYLQFLRGADVKILFDFVKEMPKPSETRINRDFLSILGPLFFTWVILQLFPVILASLVYEKQQKLRIMMKMHGLGDGPYWMITYAYFFFLSLVYMLCLVAFGSGIGLKFFTMNSYSIQFVFYFTYINLQISFAFLGATIFSNVKTATVIGHIYVFASGLLGGFLFKEFLGNTSFPRIQIILMEILPCFSLYRGLYEFGQSASTIDGMLWKDLNTNGMREVLIIIIVEWFIFLAVAYYLDQVVSIGSGVRKHPLFFLNNFQKKSSPSCQVPSLHRQGSSVSVQLEKPDVSLERKKVEQLLNEPDMNYAIICDNLKKMYPGKDGNPDKFAVRGFSLALPRGECFGMLGPNGAGKTSSINMMIGFMTPTFGTAFVHGLDIRSDMDKIYTSMGVCPQHDLLWETLTGREHLLFYGRLKNLKGAALTQAVEESLEGVNLMYGGVGDKQAGKYSGGMKRRLSVAISLIGNPKVVYMDEPSTGLDPATRNALWNAVKRAKKNCAIILTTHSMEEADMLCDRLGIFVDGRMQCIGYPAELKARYGGCYVFTMTTSPSHEKEVENLVRKLSPSANKIYHLSGTQKFELQKNEVRIADVFQAVENAKRAFTIYDWGLVSTTLEDVFIKVARGADVVS